MNITEYINSGIIEMYVMGALPSEEAEEVARLATIHPEIKTEIDNISFTIEAYARSKAKTPGPLVKVMLMATIDYMNRLKDGEIPVIPPPLSKNSKKEDFKQWLERGDMQAPTNFDRSFVKLISYTPESSTAIVWLQEGSPEEIHTHEYESFLILEGSCDIHVQDQLYQLYPGDQLTIPLHAAHSVKVTSSTPCKFILERKAA
jgi:mannose-6-phosphate isomerase-like protein (cupin superfamily)